MRAVDANVRRVAAPLARCSPPAPAHAKFDPAHRWRTAETPHFAVHFHEGVRRAGRPRRPDRRGGPRPARAPRRLDARATKTRLIIADDADAAGGWATPYPYNQILITPTPPLGEPGLGTTRHDDWLRLVITHEYTHVLQLDMALAAPAGACARSSGRLYFPNALQPAVADRGAGDLEETELTAGGRGRSPGAEMILRMAALEGPLPDPRPDGGLARRAGRPARSPTSSASPSCATSPERFGREKVAELSRAYGGRAAALPGRRPPGGGVLGDGVSRPLARVVGSAARRASGAGSAPSPRAG